MEQNPTEAQVRILISDKGDFENLFRLYYQDLCSYAHHFLKDSAAAEEIVQDIFFKLWEKREQLKVTTSIKAYLFQSTRNRCLNVIKHIDIRENYKQQNEQVRKSSELEGFDEMEVSELQDKIQVAISKLPPERQKIFMLSRYEGLRYKEIAKKLGLSPKTVENQMGRALKFLREELVEYLPLLLIILTDWMNN